MVVKLGVSTSVLGNKHELNKLLIYNPEIVEFYNYLPSFLPEIKAFCQANNIIPALHTPTPWDRKLDGFMPTGPCEQRVLDALEMVHRTVEFAAEIKALHVVVHFPSPTSDGIPDREFAIHRFLLPVARFAEEYKVKILLENVSPNPDFFTPEHYNKILTEYPILGFCLDVGHAHLLHPTCEVRDFITVIKERIRSVQLYNTHVLRYRNYGHEPIREQQYKEEGWIDILETINLLKEYSKPDAIILEYDSRWFDDISAMLEHIENIRKMIKN